MLELIPKLIPFIIAFIQERKGLKIKTTNFLAWLIENKHDLIVKEIENTANTSIYIKALLNEKLPILEELKINDEKIIEVLFKSDSKLDFLISKVNALESKLSPDSRYKQLIETLLSEIDLEEFSEEKIFDEATKKIKEFKEYSKNKHQPLNEDKFDGEYNNLISEGKIIEAKYLLKSRHLDNKINAAKRAFHLGELSYYLFDYKEAEKYFSEAVKYDESNIKYLKKAASIKNLLSKYMDGLSYYNTALQISKISNNNIETSHLLSDIGLTQEKLGNYDKKNKDTHVIYCSNASNFQNTGQG